MTQVGPAVAAVESDLAVDEPEPHGVPHIPVQHALTRWIRKQSGTQDLRVFFAAVQDIGTSQLAKLQHLGFIEKFADRQLHETLPMFTVAMIMGTVYFSFVGVCMPVASIAGLSQTSVIFHSTFCLSLVAYLQGVGTDPGRIPENWKGDPSGVPLFALRGEGVFEPFERKKTGGYRYCHKENVFKPDRAHYCSAMSRNVLRMDHYCPWLTTCVGFKNHKYFLLFLLYTVISTNLADGHMIAALAHGQHPAMQTFMLAQGTVLSSLISATLTPFFGFHCWLLAKNMTTLEYCEKRNSGDEDGLVSPYDRGLLANVRSVMGERWLLWPLPVGTPPGDGLDWELRPGAGVPVRSGPRPRELGLRILGNTATAMREIGGDLQDAVTSLFRVGLWQAAPCGAAAPGGGAAAHGRATAAA